MFARISILMLVSVAVSAQSLESWQVRQACMDEGFVRYFAKAKDAVGAEEEFKKRQWYFKQKLDAEGNRFFIQHLAAILLNKYGAQKPTDITKAAGPFGLSRAVAMGQKLVVTPSQDERFDFEKSAAGSLGFLLSLSKEYGFSDEWTLIAYNFGPGVPLRIKGRLGTLPSVQELYTYDGDEPSWNGVLNNPEQVDVLADFFSYQAAWLVARELMEESIDLPKVYGDLRIYQIYNQIPVQRGGGRTDYVRPADRFGVWAVRHVPEESSYRRVVYHNKNVAITNRDQVVAAPKLFNLLEQVKCEVDQLVSSQALSVGFEITELVVPTHLEKALLRNERMLSVKVTGSKKALPHINTILNKYRRSGWLDFQQMLIGEQVVYTLVLSPYIEIEKAER